MDMSAQMLISNVKETFNLYYAIWDPNYQEFFWNHGENGYLIK